MNLEDVLRNKISQAQKDKFLLVSHSALTYVDSNKAEHTEAERGWWLPAAGGRGRELVKAETFSFMESTPSGHLRYSTLRRVHETVLPTSDSPTADLQCSYLQNNCKGDHMR